MRTILLSAALTIVLAGCAPSALYGIRSARNAAVIDCPEHNIAGGVTCYGIDVAENREHPDGRRIRLEVMVLRARAAGPQHDPLFVIPGGPGQSATRSAGARNYFAEVFDMVRETRDIVLIAPRGTAGSGELSLEPPDDLTFSSLDTVIPPEWAAGARARLTAEVDLTQYTTSRIVEDLEATRRTLGFERINIYGTSYGTRVAQLYTARHADRVRTLILKAPLPVDEPMPLTYTAGADRALRKLFARCSGDSPCTAAYPDMEARFEALLARLEKDPVRVAAPHPFSGESVEIVINDTAFGYLLRNLLMSADGGTAVLAVIDQATKGDFDTVTALISRVRAAYATQLAAGMALSVIATEDAPRVTTAALAADTRAGFLKGAVARGLLEATRNWPRGEAPADLFIPLKGSTPVLIVTGDLDPATPPEYGQSISTRLSNSRIVVFAGGAHSGSNFNGLDAIMKSFIDSANPWAVDITAAETNQPLPLVEEESVP